MGESVFVDAFVKYPDKERAFTFFSPTSSPFRSADIGYSEPRPDSHIHRRGSQIYTVFEYVVSGKGKLSVQGKKYKINAGDVFILKPEEEHDFRGDRDEPWEKIWIKYRSDYMLPFLKAYNIDSGVYHIENAKPYFERMLNLPSTNMPANEVAYTISECVNKIVYLAAVSSSPDVESDEVRIREALNASVYEKIDLDAFAKSLHMSKSNIIRKYKKRYGVTPYEYLLSIKIETAKIMLISTKMTVREIAERLAITDEHYFSSLFYRRVGMRPLLYRKTHEEPCK